MSDKYFHNKTNNRLIVPESVHVKEIVEEMNLSPTLTRNLEDRFYYILSKLVVTNDNINQRKKNDFYVKLCATTLRDLIGKKAYRLIMKTLVAKSIIESNQSYKIPTNPEIKGECLGYRLTEDYRTGNWVYKTIETKFMIKIKNKSKRKNQTIEETADYHYLEKQFTEDSYLTIDPSVHQYIENIGSQLLDRVKNNNQYQIKYINDRIGRLKDCVNRIEKKQYWFSIAASNRRFNSTITSMPKELRPFLKYKGSYLCNIDIKASQPYFLASILNPYFYVSDSTKTYNITKVYPGIVENLTNPNETIKKRYNLKIKNYYKENNLNKSKTIEVDTVINNNKTEKSNTIYSYQIQSNRYVNQSNNYKSNSTSSINHYNASIKNLNIKNSKNENQRFYYELNKTVDINCRHHPTPSGCGSLTTDKDKLSLQPSEGLTYQTETTTSIPKTINEYCSTLNTLIDKYTIYTPYMLSTFFNQRENIESIINYQGLSFSNDFYTETLKMYKRINGQNEEVTAEERKKFKKCMMQLLFDDNPGNRNNNPEIEKFREVYPCINLYIELVLALLGSTEFALLLQRTESFVMLDIICREFDKIHPEAPLFTIHDSVLTTEEYIHPLEKHVQTRLYEITGIVPGLKKELPDHELSVMPTKELIDELWKEIEPVTTAAKFKKKKNAILKNNVDLGAKVMEDYWKQLSANHSVYSTISEGAIMTSISSLETIRSNFSGSAA